MKKVMLTGAAGQLGRALQKVLSPAEYELVLTDTAAAAGALDAPATALDITDADAVMRFVTEVKPYAVINCAAYTAVDAQEKDVDRSYRINAIGPKNLSVAATAAGAKLVHISTDYVFAGDATVPYTEFDAPAPKSVYGRTKLAGEEFVRQFADRFFIIRTAWLYGEGKNFVKTMLSLAETHDEVSVVNDQTGNPTSALELARMIAYLLPTDNYGTFHGTCEGSCSWAELAEEVFRLAGKATRVRGVTSAEYAQMNPAAAPRPAFSQLDKFMLRLTTEFRMAEWHDALEEYLKTV